jgi:hypothetical protein
MPANFHRLILKVPEEGLVLSGGRVKDVCIMREMVPLARTIAVDVKDNSSMSTASSL